MTTVTINTYDAAGRFNMENNEAKDFFKFVETQAINSGYEMVYDEATCVDEESERFITKCFENY